MDSSVASFSSILADMRRNVAFKRGTEQSVAEVVDPNACPYCGGDGEIIERNENGYTVVRTCKHCNAWRKRRVARLLASAKLPEKCLGVDVRPHPQTRQFIDNFHPNKHEWLLFVGKPGTGKTTEAAWAAREIIKHKMATVRFYNAYDVMRQLVASKRRNDDHGALTRELDEIDLIVLDDLFKALPSPKSYDYADFVAAILEIVWARYDAGKPLIVTTQADFKYISQIDAALAGRIAELCKDSTVVFGRDATNWRLQQNEQNRTTAG